MSDKGFSNKVVIFPYKDAHLEGLIDHEDMEKFLENPELKRELDKCLNESRNPK